MIQICCPSTSGVVASLRPVKCRPGPFALGIWSIGGSTEHLSRRDSVRIELRVYRLKLAKVETVHLRQKIGADHIHTLGCENGCGFSPRRQVYVSRRIGEIVTVTNLLVVVEEVVRIGFLLGDLQLDTGSGLAARDAFHVIAIYANQKNFLETQKRGEQSRMASRGHSGRSEDGIGFEHFLQNEHAFNPGNVSNRFRNISR